MYAFLPFQDVAFHRLFFCAYFLPFPPRFFSVRLIAAEEVHLDNTGKEDGDWIIESKLTLPLHFSPRIFLRFSAIAINKGSCFLLLFAARHNILSILVSP